MPNHGPQACPTCGAEPQERRRCPRCGEAEWILHHDAHYMQGAREVFGCPCPPPHTALGRRQTAASKRQAARVETGKRTNRPVSTPEMARKAAEGMVRGLRPSRALREAGYPPSTSSNGKLNKMIRAELAKMGKKYIKLGQELTPEDQENLVRGKLWENVVLGTDKGVMSAKQLGADKRVAMWQPDSQVGMVVIKAPEVPKIDHPIKLVEARYKDRRWHMSYVGPTEGRGEVSMTPAQGLRTEHVGQKLWPGERLSAAEATRRLALTQLLWAESERGMVESVRTSG